MQTAAQNQTGAGIRSWSGIKRTHLHTSESSACGLLPAAQPVQKFKEAGYTGIVVTDHFYGGNTAIDRNLPWEQWIDCKDEIWNADMRLMQKANCNEMSVGIFSWSVLEPREGEYDFSFLDEIVHNTVF